VTDTVDTATPCAMPATFSDDPSWQFRRTDI
jgi:hypothetical protein